MMLVEHAAEIFQAGSGNHNGIAATVGVLRDAQKATTGILAQVEDEILPLDRDAFTFQDLIHPYTSG